ncbi:unnamed protein product [Rhizoctonia solani]|uniref:Uncharacterized protein n=1 Tax=Rhizoctonia solani TaxID=456999 RepID=A0A8H3EA18_9AGAM|nr:unnamed protein product [Rhizoctonia solani]
MSHSARSSLSDLSVQTLPLTPAPASHKRTPSRTYFSLADEDFSAPADNAQPEAEVVHGFEKLGFGESVAIGGRRYHYLDTPACRLASHQNFNFIDPSEVYLPRFRARIFWELSGDFGLGQARYDASFGGGADASEGTTVKPLPQGLKHQEADPGRGVRSTILL